MGAALRPAQTFRVRRWAHGKSRERIFSRAQATTAMKEERKMGWAKNDGPKCVLRNGTGMQTWAKPPVGTTRHLPHTQGLLSPHHSSCLLPSVPLQDLHPRSDYPEAHPLCSDGRHPHPAVLLQSSEAARLGGSDYLSAGRCNFVMQCTACAKCSLKMAEAPMQKV